MTPMPTPAETTLTPEAAAPTAATSEAIDAAPPLPGRLVQWLSHPKAPLFAGGLFLLCLVGMGLKGGVIRLPMLGRPSIVVFDPVKFVNAQRAAASILAMSPSADLSFTLTQVARQAEAVIQAEAHGAVVLVRQSVVVPGDIPDITNAVLERFNLPTNVPTITMRPGTDDLGDIAPTDSAFSTGKLREDYRMELQQRAGVIQLANDKKTNQNKILP